jgi:hypothetical protein
MMAVNGEWRYVPGLGGTLGNNQPDKKQTVRTYDCTGTRGAKFADAARARECCVVVRCCSTMAMAQIDIATTVSRLVVTGAQLR